MTVPGWACHVRLAVGDRIDADEELFVEGPEEVVEGGFGVEGLRVDELLHRGVEFRARETFLLERIVAVVGVRRDLAVVEETRPAGLDDDGPEGLEARFADDVLRGEEEVAFPEAFDSDRPVGLGIDAEEQAGLFTRLRDPTDEGVGVPVGIGVNGSGTEGLAGEREWVVVGPVRAERGPAAAGVDRVLDLVEQASHRGDRDGVPGRRGCVRGDEAARTRGRFDRAPIRFVKAEGQAELPGEIGPEKVGIVGAVRDHLERVRAGRPVLAEAEVVVEEVPGAVARDFVEGFPRGALVGVGEQGFDPGRIEDLGLAGPAFAGGDARARSGGDIISAGAEKNNGIGGGGGGELGGDPVRGAASPFQTRGIDGAVRSAERNGDLGGVGFEGGQDPYGAARARVPGRDEYGMGDGGSGVCGE